MNKFMFGDECIGCQGPTYPKSGGDFNKIGEEISFGLVILVIVSFKFSYIYIFPNEQNHPENSITNFP